MFVCTGVMAEIPPVFMGTHPNTSKALFVKLPQRGGIFGYPKSHTFTDYDIFILVFHEDR